MYFIANSLCDIDTKLVLLGKTYNTPTREVTNIYIKNDGKSKELMLCTDVLHIPWNKTYTNDDLSFNIEFCNNNNSFVEETESLCSKITKKICKKRSITNVERGTDHFKDYPNGSKSMRFFNVKIHDISVYDENGTVLNVSQISRNDDVKCLIHIKACWFRENKFGIEMYIVQMLRKSPYVSLNKRTMLLAEAFTQFSKEDEEIYNKYAKMLQVGVPLNSVQNAFSMDKTVKEDSKRTLSKKLGFTNVDQVISIPPPPPPPPPPMLMPNKLQIVSNKKDERIQSTPTPASSLSTLITINELQDAITKLKKHKMENK